MGKLDWRILVCAGSLLAAAGCGERTPPQAAPSPQAAVEDPEQLANLSIADESAQEFVLPESEHDKGIELLSGSVHPAKTDYRRSFLATVRIDHGGRVTTGSVLHCSARHGVYILTCRHGREAGGPWVARCSGGAIV